VYNASRHGVQDLTHQVGVALSDSQGSIGDGEARVNVSLDLNVAPPGEPIPWPPCGCDPAAGFKCVNHHKPEEDVANLTQAESDLLGEILENYFVNEAGNIPDEKQDVVDTLMNKLID
jgi:hypothetical protein